MQQTVLGEGLNSVAAETAVEMTTSPFLPHRSAVAKLNVSSNFNGTVKIQGSDDGTTYTDLLTVTGTTQPNKEAQVTLKKYMRANVTAYTAGSANAYLNAGA